MRGVLIIIVDIITTNNVVLTKISFCSQYAFTVKHEAHSNIYWEKQVMLVKSPHLQLIGSIVKYSPSNCNFCIKA
jgi:hypothetical protein